MGSGLKINMGRVGEQHEGDMMARHLSEGEKRNHDIIKQVRVCAVRQSSANGERVDVHLIGRNAELSLESIGPASK